MKSFLFLLLAVIFFISANQTFAQTKKGITSKSKTNSTNKITPLIAVKQLRDFYFNRDFNGGSELGQQLIKQFPDNLELQTWGMMNLARSDDSSKAINFAEDLIKKKGENVWTLILLTVAQAYNKREIALSTAEKLMKIAPDDEQAIFAYNLALYQNRKYQESLDYLEKNKSKIKDLSRLLTQQALSTYFSEVKKEKGQIQRSFDLFAQAVKANPKSVNANYLYGYYLGEAKRYDEALSFLRKAAILSPNGDGLQDEYWRTISLQQNKTEAQKKAELDKAISSYVLVTKNSPQALLVVWKKYRALSGWKDENKLEEVKKRDYYEKLILQKFPNTKYEEEVAYLNIQTVYGKYFGKQDNNRFEEIGLKKKSDRTAEENVLYEKYEKLEKLYQKEQISLQRAYLKRSKHLSQNYLNQTAFSLFRQLCSQKDSNDEEISALLKIFSTNYGDYYGNLNSTIASYLVEIKTQRPDSKVAKEAEKYARLGINEAENKVKELPANSSKIKIYEIKVMPVNTLAESLIIQNKFDEAEKLLKEAAEMKDDNGSENFRLDEAAYTNRRGWARFYEAKKDWNKAEAFYIENGSDNEWTRNIFEGFYERKNGKKDGFDNYYVRIEAKLKANKKLKLAKSRIKDAQPMVAFDLKSLDDKTVSSTDLKGKVIVINIWGTWCGPCVAEMPELQKLFDKYKNDKDVAIFTLDTGDELAVVKKFMADKKYTLPVLIDANYTDKIPQFSTMRVYPTTFFIDKNGKVSFIARGASSDLLQTFSWRIDILKEEK